MMNGEEVISQETIDEVMQITTGMMRMSDNPPTPGCSCTACLVKTCLAGLRTYDREKFDQIKAEITTMASAWSRMTMQALEISVTDFLYSKIIPVMDAVVKRVMSELTGVETPEIEKLTPEQLEQMTKEENIPAVDTAAIDGFLMKAAKA